MISEAYTLFGCNTADLFVMSVDLGDTDAECIQFDLTYGIEFPTISGIEGGGNAINSTYGIFAYPTYILIAPNHSIVEQDMWPISSTQTFINYFESNSLVQSECGVTGVTASFTSDLTTTCSLDPVLFTDLSSGSITSWSWTFEGGEPATSTDQNPTVIYNEAGIFDVSLEVSDGTNTNILTMNDYMTVIASPPAMLQAFGDVCLTDPAFELTGGSPAGGVYSGPGVSNNWFDPAVAGLGTHQIVYTYTAASTGCDNSAEQPILVDVCDGIYDQAGEFLRIYPNPTSGLFQLEFTAIGKVDIQVINLPGVVVYQTSLSSQGRVSESMNLTDLESGFYFISIKTRDKTIVQKLKLNSN